MHRQSKVSQRYAKSLLQFAEEQKAVKAVAEDMAVVAETCENSRELTNLLKSPIVKTDKKIAILQQIFSGKVGTITSKFFEVLAKKKREGIIGDIAKAFTAMYKAEQGIVSAEITTAGPLDDATKAKANKMLQYFGDKTELTEKVDPSIIGGFIIRVGDRQYDESVANKIRNLKRTFSKNTYLTDL